MTDFEKMIPSSINIIEAMPYIRRYHGKTMVIKFGGNAMFNDEIKKMVAWDIVFLKLVGMKPVVVHGGGPAINEHMERVGIEPEFVDGLRKTDTETLEIVEMVLCGKVNNEIVKLVNIQGAKSVGLSGKDGGLIKATKRAHEVEENGEAKKVDLGQVGDVVGVDTGIINVLINNDFIPVIAPIGLGIEDLADYNINADVLAGEMASALKAEKLLMLTNVNGIQREEGNEESRIPRMTIPEARGHLGKLIVGGMIPKVEACIDSLEKGLVSAHVINGMTPHAMLQELLTDDAIGTMIYEGKEE